ncbi:MAG: hypothetical protein HS104_02315 [Polyangiaceae bacterium]|nr:hypothetical protein [Polyangiaceae bacterium]MCE7892546.1 hypothetical protein [Sorangiineae bacterium PRO1]MCL4751120.1 hypothetical protein [Myxococcales bacterium]
MSDRTDPPTIDLASDVSSFFGPVVAEAIRARGYEATDAAEAYLVALLADYTKPGQLGEETLSRPLTLLLDEAMQRTGPERFERLRVLGDGVLYVSGFFGEHLETRGVEPRYMSTLGACAYENASAMLRQRANDLSAPDLFAELAEKFRMFVSLLADVAESLRARSARTDGAVVKLYERWLKTGSSTLGDALVARGMVPLRGTGLVH